MRAPIARRKGGTRGPAQAAAAARQDNTHVRTTSATTTMASAGGGQRRGANEEAPLDMRGPMAAVTYALVSICIMLFNKAVLTEYGFTYPKVLTLCQSTATFVMMRLLGHFQVISFDEIDTEKLKAVAPLSFLFLAYVLISLSALGNVNMPMFAALRRTTVVFVMIAECVAALEACSGNVWLPLHCVGAFAVGWTHILRNTP